MTSPQPEPQQKQQGQVEITVLTRTTGLNLITCLRRQHRRSEQQQKLASGPKGRDVQCDLAS